MKKILIILSMVSVVGLCRAMSDADVQALVETHNWSDVDDQVGDGHISPEQLCRYDKAQLDGQDHEKRPLFLELIWDLDYHQRHGHENEERRISECLKALIQADKVTHSTQLIDDKLTQQTAARCRPLYANILKSINDERERSTPSIILHIRSHVLWYLAGGAAVVALAVGAWKYYHSTSEIHDEAADEKTESTLEIAA